MSNKLFLAIQVNQDIRNQVRDLNRALRKNFDFFTYVELEKLHITTQYLGDQVSDNSMQIISAHLDNHVPHQNQFDIFSGRLNFGYPGEIKPHLLFLDFASNKALNELTKLVTAQIFSLNLRDVTQYKTRKTKIHHMTVARFRKKSSKRQLLEVKNFIKGYQIPKQKLTIEKLGLYSSEFFKNKVKYNQLYSWDLLG